MREFRAIGFAAGQVGDLVMHTVVAREFKKDFPNYNLTFALGKIYKNCACLFENIKYIDSLHIWSEYYPWPTQEDLLFLDKNKFDLIFQAFPKHTCFNWYNYRHYIEETCMMHGFRSPSNSQCELSDISPNFLMRDASYITTSLFCSGNLESKTLSILNIEKLYSIINSLGYKVIAIGSNDPIINGAENFRGGMREAVGLLRSSKLHLTVDTAFSWIASAYSVPTIGFYGIAYADMPLERVCSHNPVNPNAIYLNRSRTSDISVDEIIENIKNII